MYRKLILLSSGIPSIPTKPQDLNDFETITECDGRTHLSEEFGQFIWIFVMSVHLPMRHHMGCILCPFTVSHLNVLLDWQTEWSFISTQMILQTFSLKIIVQTTEKWSCVKKFIQLQVKMVKHIQIYIYELRIINVQ